MFCSVNMKLTNNIKNYTNDDIVKKSVRGEIRRTSLKSYRDKTSLKKITGYSKNNLYNFTH